MQTPQYGQQDAQGAFFHLTRVFCCPMSILVKSVHRARCTSLSGPRDARALRIFKHPEAKGTFLTSFLGISLGGRSPYNYFTLYLACPKENAKPKKKRTQQLGAKKDQKRSYNISKKQQPQEQTTTKTNAEMHKQTKTEEDSTTARKQSRPQIGK